MCENNVTKQNIRMLVNYDLDVFSGYCLSYTDALKSVAGHFISFKSSEVRSMEACFCHGIKNNISHNSVFFKQFLSLYLAIASYKLV